jgi:hypothetical protein
MKLRTLWDEPLGMLMASGSPGSALAYQLGQAEFESGMMRRNTSRDAKSADKTKANRAAAPLPSARGWIGRMFERIEAWAWERELRQREAYLAQAQDLYDLERRMRQLDGDDFLSRGRALY